MKETLRTGLRRLVKNLMNITKMRLTQQDQALVEGKL
jgi:hypothetical protein